MAIGQVIPLQASAARPEYLAKIRVPDLDEQAPPAQANQSFVRKYVSCLCHCFPPLLNDFA